MVDNKDSAHLHMQDMQSFLPVTLHTHWDSLPGSDRFGAINRVTWQ